MNEGNFYTFRKLEIHGLEHVETPYGELEVMRTRTGTVVRGYMRHTLSHDLEREAVPSEHFPELNALLTDMGYKNPIWFGKSK